MGLFRGRFACFWALLALILALIFSGCAVDEGWPLGGEDAELLLLFGPGVEADAGLTLYEKYQGQLAVAAAPENPEAAGELLAAYPAAQVVILAGARLDVAALQAVKDNMPTDGQLIAVPLEEELRPDLATVADQVMGINWAARPGKIVQQGLELDASALVCFCEDEAEAERFRLAGVEQGLDIVVLPWPEDPAAAVANLVAEYGTDCGFVAVDEEWERELLPLVLAEKAKYPLTYAPTPYAWAAAAGAEIPERPCAEVADFIAGVRNWLMNEVYLSRRCSAWRKPLDYGAVSGAVSYGADWLAGLSDPAQVRQSLLNADACRIEQAGDNYWLLLVNTYIFGSNTNMDCDC